MPELHRRRLANGQPAAVGNWGIRGVRAHLNRVREREGIALAKQRGAYRGCKKALVDNQVVELRRRAGADEQKSKLAREFGISRETLYQYLKVAPTA